MKVQETVYDLLTQQYELARIQEAKEIPTVNVIDPANIPERKSYPPRLLIIVVITAMSLAIATIFIVGSARWQEKDPRDPKKRFANRVWQRGLDWGQQTATRLHLVRVSRFVAERRQRSEE
jgi:hypothetical protein